MKTYITQYIDENFYTGEQNIFAGPRLIANDWNDALFVLRYCENKNITRVGVLKQTIPFDKSDTYKNN